MASKDDLLADGKEAFRLASDAEADNRAAAENALRFIHGEQWDENIVKQRIREKRPVLTINKLPAFVRQVVNDARQNKPSIQVHPVDDKADRETADVLAGLIRNIEYTSNADVAYDTAMECAVKGGVGYIRIGDDYSYQDAFEMDLRIMRVLNPFAVYGDPYSVEADSCDWMNAFVLERLSKAQFAAKYGKDTKSFRDWDDSTAFEGEGWTEGAERTVAEWWHRTEERVNLYLMNDGTVLDEESFESEDVQMFLATGIAQVVQQREGRRYKVRQHIMTGAEVIETNDWKGCYIPIIPVYGEEYDIKGKRYFRGLCNNAFDAQRMVNYWRTTATELVALAPRVPYIGPKGAFDHDQERWQTANTTSHAYLEYGGGTPPQRQPLDSGIAAGALQEALNASDDMKSIIGLYDASLGARSNETSGRAIMARQREGDVSTFHFMDNMNRAIRHVGKVLIDLIPSYYSQARIIRVLGEDGTPENKPIGQQYPVTDPKTGQPVQDESGNVIMAMHDFSVGKYDVAVKSGPSFTTRREEAAAQMTELVRAFPPAAPIIGPELAKNLDWPGADKIAEKLEAQTQPQVPPELQQQIEQGKQLIEQQAQEIQTLKTDQSVEVQKARAQIASNEEIERQKIASQERIAKMKMEADARIALMKTQMMPINSGLTA